MLAFAYRVTMARVDLVSFVLVGVNSESVTRRLRQETPFCVIFGAYVGQFGYSQAVTRFYYLNGVVEWGTTPKDHRIPDGGRINVVLFGWIFIAADLGYFDQWGEPPSHRGGTYSRAALNAERGQLNGLGCVNGMRVPDDRRGEYVAHLFGTHRGNFLGQETHEEVILTQMEVLRKSATALQVRFVRHLDADQVRLAGQRLCYGLYRMLVLTSGGFLLTGGVSARRLGGFRIVYQMMGLSALS